MKEDLYDGYQEEVEGEVQELLTRELAPYQILTNGLIAGMDLVGEDFREGILFVPEVLMAAKAMKGGMAILRPLLSETDAPTQGTVLIGTVKGDIHDIGKDLVAMLLEGAGFKVINIGVNNDVEDFLEAIEEHKPEILGMSALLTTTMPYMETVIKSLEENGIRDQLIVLVGGAPLHEAFAKEIGADAYCRDAAMAVDTVRKMLEIV
jgi:5-methyltetrahydrofolate--homocysteine methyltransferase